MENVAFDHGGAVNLTQFARMLPLTTPLTAAADLGFIPVMVMDTCGAGDAEAGARAVAALGYAGDTVIIESAVLIAALAK
jgi:hypothetical protein